MILFRFSMLLKIILCMHTQPVIEFRLWNLNGTKKRERWKFSSIPHIANANFFRMVHKNYVFCYTKESYPFRWAPWNMKGKLFLTCWPWEKNFCSISSKWNFETVRNKLFVGFCYHQLCSHTFKVFDKITQLMNQSIKIPEFLISW